MFKNFRNVIPMLKLVCISKVLLNYKVLQYSNIDIDNNTVSLFFSVVMKFYWGIAKDAEHYKEYCKDGL